MAKPKSPFDDEELNRIYDACDSIGTPTKSGPGYRTWGGENAKDFIFFSVYTGLRISDVVTFDITKKLERNDVFLRMHKTGKPLFTWIPDWLVVRLRAREKIHGPYIFRCGVTENAKQLCDIWRNKRLSRIFELAGPFEEKPTPHRFRHTFARILLDTPVHMEMACMLDIAENRPNRTRNFCRAATRLLERRIQAYSFWHVRFHACSKEVIWEDSSRTYTGEEPIPQNQLVFTIVRWRNGLSVQALKDDRQDSLPVFFREVGYRTDERAIRSQ